ncbi:hypothetical protein SAMN02745135_01585 [Caloranaerobacter azorensis DSM 13643]|uniref:Uncharacterized protein n=1 Tax=Caloranaerobacter azorensis DSM 13643 TaxID=1121264 RepID=A0A1M5UUF5_9FIRM|nr:hypothetical protein [Caloranaerobacter azorensis]SHH66632.1 hypothetical protein SAMN02745135_01585 [Caloranaerobacter azorensis DSM 13643]
MLDNLKKLILFMKKRLDGKDKRNIAILIFIALLTNILIVHQFTRLIKPQSHCI